jgi:hypothetical protein
VVMCGCWGGEKEGSIHVVMCSGWGVYSGWFENIKKSVSLHNVKRVGESPSADQAGGTK